MSEPLPETVVEERDRLRAERNRAESALTDQGRAEELLDLCDEPDSVRHALVLAALITGQDPA